MDRQAWKSVILPLLPNRARLALQQLHDTRPLLEIRLRLGSPIQLVYADGDRLIWAPQGKGLLCEQECVELLARICEQSIYAWTEEMKNGFITLQGGYRVGICGRAIRDGGQVERFSEVNSFNFRIVRAVEGCASSLLPYLIDNDGKLCSTLIISPPGVGKTTMLRDVIRLVSWGINIAPQRISLADERFEIAGCIRGVPQFDVGPRTDIMSGMSKSDAMKRMLASMSPQVIATDELHFDRDADAALEARSCGVSVLATAHGVDCQDIQKRIPMARLIEQRTFSRYVRMKGVGIVDGVQDDRGEEVQACSGS